MKKLLTVSLMLLGSVAFGSKARMEALQNAFHLHDNETILEAPTDAYFLSDSMVFDFGSNAIGQNTQGSMLRSMGDNKLAFFVGATDEARTNGYLGVENPFSIAYASKAGDVQWGVAFSYSDSTKKATASAADDQKQSQMNLTGSAVIGDFTVGLALGLVDTAKGIGGLTAGNEGFKYSNAPVLLFGKYAMNDMTFRADVMTQTEKDDSSGTSVKTDSSLMRVGVINSMKKDGADFFYGASYAMVTSKTSAGKFTASIMPVIMGIEGDAATWLTLRGSVTQNVLLGSTKDTGAGTGEDSIDHNTTVAAGAGFKFNKAVLDITLQGTGGAGNGQLNSNLGANAGLTYLF